MRLCIKCLLFLSDVNQIWNMSTNLMKSPISAFTGIRPLGTEMFHTDGRTGGRVANVAFRNWFATAPEDAFLK